jgi:hypothetical protein
VIRNRLLAPLIAALVATGAIGAVSTAAASASHTIRLAPPTQKVGSHSHRGTAGGSKHGKFTGKFFG